MLHFRLDRPTTFRKSPLIRIAIICVLVLQVGCSSFTRGASTSVIDPSKQKADIQLALAQTAERKGEVADAILSYQKVTELDDQNAEAWHHLGLMQDQMGRASEATENYRRSLAITDSQPTVWNDLGYNLYLLEQWSESEAALQKAISLDASAPRARINYGLLLARTGRPNESMRQFYHSGITEAEARCNIAIALLEEGQVAGAAQQLNLAQQADLDGLATEKIAGARRLCNLAQQSAERMANQNQQPAGQF